MSSSVLSSKQKKENDVVGPDEEPYLKDKTTPFKYNEEKQRLTKVVEIRKSNRDHRVRNCVLKFLKLNI